MKEQKRRSFIKGITYRLMATLATFTLALWFTGSLEIAGQIGVLDFIIKFIIYYTNERVWNYTNWGYRSVQSNGIEPQNSTKRVAEFEH